jgi:shikimate kinase
MGAGKTTVGQILARRWEVVLRDTDADIERAQGKPISEIFIDDGEPHFRTLESAAVEAALAEHEGVGVPGGGAVMSPANSGSLGGHQVVFLDVGLSQASARVGLGVTRPMLLGNVRGQLKTLMDERRPLYAEVALATVLTDELDAEAVADAVEKALA